MLYLYKLSDDPHLIDRQSEQALEDGAGARALTTATMGDYDDRRKKHDESDEYVEEKRREFSAEDRGQRQEDSTWSKGKIYEEREEDVGDGI